MNKKSLILIVVQSFVIMILIWVVIFIGSDEFAEDDLLDDEKSVSFLETNADGLNQVRLNQSIVKNSGIMTERIQTSDKSMSFSNYGVVQATDTLIDLKNIHDQLLQDIATLQNQKKAEEKKYFAFLELNKDEKNISDQVLLDQEAILNNLAVILEKKVALKSNLKQKVITQWGDKFYRLISENADKSNLKKILQGSARLIKITLPSADSNNPVPKKIIFSPINGNSEIEGTFVAEAPTIEPSILGQTFYYLIDSSEIRIGSKLIGFYINDQRNQDKLYEIPNSAIVWSNGISWVYTETENALFIKKPINLINEIKSGWLVESKLLNDKDLLVTNGAQLLLSEEYKYQIKNENED